MEFGREADFEDALIRVLQTKGWEKEVLRYPTEQDLIRNWADILFQNNRQQDRLGDFPLTEGEMQQILEQVACLRTPLNLNGFINGKTVAIKRDHPEDRAHFGKEVSLKIYDRNEVAGGQSRYQIAQQPLFPTRSPLLNDRRGDLMLLINGMPLFHIELKKTGVPVSEAYHQIEKYAGEGIFTGLFSLVQIFVAMNPDETRYFANPGPDGRFNPDFYFHWADFNNEPIQDWARIASTLLSIPMAHQLIGFYTVADHSDGILKVMRSYQYYAASAISDAVSEAGKEWDGGTQRGGYIWHTTGSGKTMTSFKSAQLIANSGDADKVVFLTDRIELGTQSLKEYRGFADDRETVQETENTYVLLSKLKSTSRSDTLIVTSIQKMSNIWEEGDGHIADDISQINQKRIVFIVDEAHRSTFGEMLARIKETLPRAIFFGFTGTPIFDENAKHSNDQTDVFGRELHRYSIADGIRDRNVLGFDPYKVLTFKDLDVRRAVALQAAKAETEEEALRDPAKKAIYLKFMDKSKVKMCGEERPDGKWVKGIEDDLPDSQYKTDEHRSMVLQDMKESWMTLSQAGKFHAIFATSSISEAVAYYRLLKEGMPELKTTCLFDPNIDNDGGAKTKEDALAEILADYNVRYNQSFTIPTHAAFKKDLADRLAHKGLYKRVETEPEKQLQLLIVVDQMLTGFDSKWVNTLYLDKLLRYADVIQAFSRTNRLFGPEKPFGVIRYYRRPHTMERNVQEAMKLYSGDRPIGLFVEKLRHNLDQLNACYQAIADLFAEAGVEDFARLPDERRECAKFADLFNHWNDYLQAARVQGFTWKKRTYSGRDEKSGKYKIEMLFTEREYLILLQRYKELFSGGGPGDPVDDVPFDLRGSLTQIDTGAIDAEYMNNKFEKYLKELHTEGAAGERLEQIKDELHRSFAGLSQEDQKYANLFLHDIECGDVMPEEGKTMRDYITEYRCGAKNAQIHSLAVAFGLDEGKLRDMVMRGLTEKNINEYGKYDALRETVDKAAAKAYLEEREGKSLPPPKVNMKIDGLLRKFILSGGFDL